MVGVNDEIEIRPMTSAKLRMTAWSYPFRIRALCAASTNMKIAVEHGRWERSPVLSLSPDMDIGDLFESERPETEGVSQPRRKALSP